MPDSHDDLEMPRMADARGQDVIGTGELVRNFRDFRAQYIRDQKDSGTRFDRLQAAIESLQFITPAVYQAHRESDQRRLEQLELADLKRIEDQRQTNRILLTQALGTLTALAVAIIPKIL